MECCYLIRRSILTDDSLDQLDTALTQFHHYRQVFKAIGVRADGMSLPRQHSLDHYPRHIREFGAPNGLCSSITESKHIKAVKEPWRRSNRFDALGQMLVTNQRLDKLAAARNDFHERGMLSGSLLSSVTISPELPTATATPSHTPTPLEEAQTNAYTRNNEIDENLDDENDEGDAVEGPRILASVHLAQQNGMNTL